MDQKILAREGALVNAQSLLQEALDTVFGNPRVYEESDPKLTEKLFAEQRVKLNDRLEWSSWRVNRLFSDDYNMKVKELAEVLCVLGYDLEMTIKLKETDM